MVSVVVAAHNEESTLGACLDALLANAGDERLEIIVSANGCTDKTAQIAADRGVIVIDRAEAGKPGALNAAEEIATRFPRIYLDADIVIPPGGLSAILTRFGQSPAPFAVVPRRRIRTSGRPWPVRAYFAVNERLPVFRDGLFGRGMITISEVARQRFTTFPNMVADDLFLDAQFAAGEKVEAHDVDILVEAPHSTRELINRLVRVRRGNAEMRTASTEGSVDAVVRPSDKWSWFRDVVIPEPRLTFAAVPYVLITVTAGILARRRAGATGGWGRDDSTRRAAQTTAPVR